MFENKLFQTYSVADSFLIKLFFSIKFIVSLTMDLTERKCFVVFQKCSLITTSFFILQVLKIRFSESYCYFRKMIEKTQNYSPLYNFPQASRYDFFIKACCLFNIRLFNLLFKFVLNILTKYSSSDFWSFKILQWTFCHRYPRFIFLKTANHDHFIYMKHSITITPSKHHVT